MYFKKHPCKVYTTTKLLRCSVSARILRVKPEAGDTSFSSIVTCSTYSKETKPSQEIAELDDARTTSVRSLSHLDDLGSAIDTPKCLHSASSRTTNGATRTPGTGAGVMQQKQCTEIHQKKRGDQPLHTELRWHCHTSLALQITGIMVYIRFV